MSAENRLSGAADRPVSAADAPFRIRWLADMLTADQNSLGVIRLLLALAVLVSHSIYLTTGRGELEPLYRWTNYTLGQHGVQVFFFLSGILVAQSLFKSRSVLDYATARALRIFPALIACVLVTAIVMGLALTTLPPVAYLKDQGVAAYIAKTISLWSGSAQLPGVFRDNQVPGVVNTSVWTLKYEALCYVLLAVAGAVVLKMQRWREAAFVFIALWLALVLAKPVGLELHGGAKSTLEVLRYFTVFFGAGVVAYAARYWIPIHAVMLVPLGTMFAVAIGTRFQEPAAAIFLGYLALWLATFRFGGLREVTNQSDYSYATYLYHMPVGQVLLHMWPDMHVAALILATTGITIWIAFFSWELIERPALALRHKLWKRAPREAEGVVKAAPEAATTIGAPTAGTASARTAERFGRHVAAVHKVARSAASRSIDVATATANVAIRSKAEPPREAASKSEPLAAQIWRPMPVVRKLKIHADEASEASAQTSATRAVSRIAMPLDLIKKATKRSAPLPPDLRPLVPEYVAPKVPVSRIAFATKRPAAADAPPIATVSTPTEAPASPDAPDADGDTARRPSQPRPSWSRPLREGRPQSA